MNINPKNTKDNISKHMLADGMSQIIDLEKSHGSWLVDGRDNRQYLDLFLCLHLYLLATTIHIF